jgi:hypothetical protein
MHPVETRLSRVIKKLAYYCKEARKLRAIEHRMDCRASPKRSVFTQAPEEGDIGAAQSHGHRWQSMTTAALHIADHESVTFRATLKACRLQDFGAQRPSISLASTRWASSARSGYASLIAAAAFMELAAL